MSRSNDAGHFFQTSDSLATTERKTVKAKNKHGKPIIFPSKILAVHVDLLNNGAVLVAEAAAQIKRVHLEVCKGYLSMQWYPYADGHQSGKKDLLPLEATAPLTSIAISRKPNCIFAACWDKSIYGSASSAPSSSGQKRFTGHTDFVKCLLSTTLSGKPVLISGSADACIIVWDIETGNVLHKLKGHTKSVQDLAVDPLCVPEGAIEPADSLVLFSASSDREIRRWHVSIDSARFIPPMSA